MEKIDVKDLKIGVAGTVGSEAIVFECDKGLFKKFLPSLDISVKLNKETKLKLLDSYPSLKPYYNQIDYLVYDSNEFKGYVIVPTIGTPLDETNLELSDKINVLKKLRQILKEFNEKNIFYDDIHLGNIYYKQDTGGIELIDIDNIAIDNYPSDLVSFLTYLYMNYGGYDIKNSRIFSFNLITYIMLFNKKTYDLNDLRINSLKTGNKEIDKFIYCLLEPRIVSSCDNEYLIDMVDEKILSL